MKALQPHLAERPEDYSPLVAVGLGLAVLMLLMLAVYWIGDAPRLSAAAADLLHERVQRGEEIYAGQCASCHGAEGEGGVGPALKNKTVLKNTPDQIFFSIIRSGVPNTQMPSWSVDFGGPLTNEDIHDVVAFMRSWESTAPEIQTQVSLPDPSQGALLFASTCAVCHGNNGQGGQPGIPTLNDPVRLAKFDDEWYRNVISHGRPAKGMPTWGTVLAPEQINDLVALLAAWRNREAVRPAFELSDLVELAIFALSQGDPASAQLQVDRALDTSTGITAELLQEVKVQIESGDLTGAEQTLISLMESWPPGDSQAGAAVYVAQCAVCHGQQGEGGVGKPLQGSEWIAGVSNADLLDLIRQGRPGTAMAGFAEQLSEQQIADVVAWLRSWQK